MDEVWVGDGGSNGSCDPRTRSRACLDCGRELEAVREWHRYCSDACRARHHRDDRQRRLDFTPAASQLAHAVRGRETKAQRILARLRIGPATTWELQRIAGRFSARLHELEEKGLRYERQDFKTAGSEHSVYTMTQEPKEE